MNSHFRIQLDLRGAYIKGIHNMKPVLIFTAFLALIGSANAEEAKAPHARVTYSNLEARQAEAMAQPLAPAGKVYADEFGFNMPETVTLSVKCEADQQTGLYTDGEDRMFLSIPSREKLAKPAKSGAGTGDPPGDSVQPHP